MPSQPLYEQIEANGCSISLRRVSGPESRELFFSCQAPSGVSSAGAQTKAIYNAIEEILQRAGGNFADVVTEMLFLRDTTQDIEAVRGARSNVIAASGQSPAQSAVTEIEQPPLKADACLEVLVHAGIPIAASQTEVIEVAAPCDCAECARVHGLRIQAGQEARFHAANLYGAGKDAYEQTHGMFALAERLLEKAGMTFQDVTRTWIHLREMERDYPGLNRARREFFEARGIDPVPASTAIGGGPVPNNHHLSLGIYALKSGSGLQRTVMTSPTLNEAPEYGADFVRGMRVPESNKVSLLVSGTASVDEAGNTVHIDDFAAQADRMLVNLTALLKGQGANFDNVVSAISYVKDPANAQVLEKKFQAAGFTGFPNVLVEAPVCRPDLLCETELIAVLPK